MVVECFPAKGGKQQNAGVFSFIVRKDAYTIQSLLLKPNITRPRGGFFPSSSFICGDFV